MRYDFAVDDFKQPPHPKGLSLLGNSVKLEPIDVEAHASDLYEAFSLDVKGEIWKYLPYGSFEKFEDFYHWLTNEIAKDEATFFSIIRLTDGKAVGVAAYLRINQIEGSIEVGHLNYSPILQRTTLATEAMYLMMKWAFENGYRRYEWKCNALNVKSRKAAQRLGFSFEGVFRQSNIVKGRNRNTAWFGIIDSEWNSLKKQFERYLSDENFDAENNQIQSLSQLTQPLLYKLDTFELSGVEH